MVDIGDGGLGDLADPLPPVPITSRIWSLGMVKWVMRGAFMAPTL